MTEAYVKPLARTWGRPTVVCAGSTVARRVADRLAETADVATSVAADRRDARAADADAVVAVDPEVDGLALLRRIREESPTRPVVLVAVEGSESLAAAAANGGVDGYVGTDPLPVERIADRLRTAIDRHRKGREHEQATRLLSRLTEYTNDALWMFSGDWSELRFINSAYEDLWGDSVETLVEEPTTFLEGVHPDDRPEVTDAMETLSAGTPQDLEYRVNAEADFGTWVSVHAEPITAPDGSVEAIAGYARDVTNRKRREQALAEYRDELERSNESLQEFAYIASHDLQEPLRMVSSYVDLIETEYGDEFDAEAREYMDYASEGARRMQRMIDSLLTYSRVHQRAKETSPVDATDVVADARQDLEVLRSETGAEIQTERLPTVDADRTQLAQVFQNLLKNAIEHAGDGASPRVDVSATVTDGRAEFAVSDNGPGIPAAQQDEIFEIFAQGSEASATDSTGIGLAVARRIVERHGGEIWVESAAGDGATFRFTLPLAEQEATA